MVTTIADVLNLWNDLGVFSYAIPFLLIFAVVFAILDKTKMLSPSDSEDHRKHKYIEAIIAASIGLLSLQFDFVPEFFSVIFPRFGIGISIFLVAVVLIGFFHPNKVNEVNKPLAWIGWLTGIGVIIWALSWWDDWHSYTGFGGWFTDNVWSLIILGAVIGVIVATITSGDDHDNNSNSERRGGRRH